MLSDHVDSPEIYLPPGLRHGPPCSHLRILIPVSFPAVWSTKLYEAVSFHHNVKGSCAIVLPTSPDTSPMPLCELPWALSASIVLSSSSQEGWLWNFATFPSPSWERRHIIPLVFLYIPVPLFHFLSLVLCGQVTSGLMSTCFLTNTPCSPTQRKVFYLFLFVISSSSVKWVVWLGKYSCNLIINVRIFAFRGRKEIE